MLFSCMLDSNDKLSNANNTELANNIINIGLNCKNHGVGKVFISSILVKKNPKLNFVIHRVNDKLHSLCEINGFLFINNEMIFARYWYKCLVQKFLPGFE